MVKHKSVRSGDSVTFKFEKKGDKLVGYYVGTTEEVINNAPCKKHTFVTATGRISILGQADLYKQLIQNECLNMAVEAIFTGEYQKLKGGKTMKLYDLYFTPEDMYSGAPLVLKEEDTSAEPDYSTEEEVPGDEIAYVAPVAPKRPTAAPTAATQTRVQDLLNRSRNKSA